MRQWSLRKTGTVRTLARRAEIGPCSRDASTGAWGITYGKKLSLYAVHNSFLNTNNRN